MSLTQINDYGVGNVNLTSLMETLDRQRRGYKAISLTHYDDNLEPKIAAGSIVELGGALFKAETDESITGWAGIGNESHTYIKFVPSGATATAAFVTAAPTWSTSKQGWYVGNDRYIGGLYKDISGNYARKWLFLHEAVKQFRIVGDGNISFSGADLTADEVTTGANINLSADAERTSTDEGGYRKLKEIVSPFYGVINVYFEIASTLGSLTVYGKVYKNGTPVGVQRSTQSTSYVSFNENFSVVAGDRIQLYVYPEGTSDTAKTRNFRIRSSKVLPTILGTILQNTMTTVDVSNSG